MKDTMHIFHGELAANLPHDPQSTFTISPQPPITSKNYSTCYMILLISVFTSLRNYLNIHGFPNGSLEREYCANINSRLYAHAHALHRWQAQRPVLLVMYSAYNAFCYYINSLYRLTFAFFTCNWEHILLLGPRPCILSMARARNRN